MRKVDDPEQDYEVEVTFVLKGYGKQRHAESQIIRSYDVMALNFGKDKVEVKDTF